MLIIKTFLQRRKGKFPSEVNWTYRKECLLIYPLTIMFKVPKMCQKPKKLGCKRKETWQMYQWLLIYQIMLFSFQETWSWNLSECDSENFILSNAGATALGSSQHQGSLRWSKPMIRRHGCLNGGTITGREHDHSRFGRKQLETSLTSEFYRRLALNSGGKVSEVC